MSRVAYNISLLIALNVVLGVLPIVFVVATSVMVGRVPEAVAGGVGSAKWESLVIAFGIAVLVTWQLDLVIWSAS